MTRCIVCKTNENIAFARCGFCGGDVCINCSTWRATIMKIKDDDGRGRNVLDSYHHWCGKCPYDFVNF